jgi:RNA polymerase sigma factor (TIGR02999 family)
MAEAQLPFERVEQLIAASGAGDDAAFDELFSILYPELRRIAHAHLRAERAHHTLSTTALVHEAYVRIATWSGEGWHGRAQFLAFTSRAMRHILVDYARRRQSVKRGDGRVQVPLDVAGDVAAEENTVDVLALSQALDQLGERDPRLVRVVECRFFGGLTADETAEALGMPLRTVERTWTRAKTYLYQLLLPPPHQG